MTAIEESNIVRSRVVLRNPISVERLPLLCRVYQFAFRRRRRGLAKRMIGRPAKYLFGLMMASGVTGTGHVRVETSSGPRPVAFDARNTQFSAIYMHDYRPVYEVETSTVLDRLVGDKDVFFDIGANWGWYSIFIASRPSFEGSIHAFEPFPLNFADLVKFTEGAGFKNRINCHDIALSDKEGEASMSLPDGIHNGLARLGDERGIKVRLAPLDKLDLPTPDVIKIDVEDHEMGVLMGAAGIIEKARPFIVMENWLHRDKPRMTMDPLQLLVTSGYALFYPGWIKGDPDHVNFAPGEFIPDKDCDLALVPFLPIHRFQLGPLINIVAVHRDRIGEFHARFR